MSFTIRALCSANSTHPPPGQARFNHHGKGCVKAFPAGSQPLGKTTPVAVETPGKHSIPRPDTACPVWREHPTTAHRAIAAPVHVRPIAAKMIQEETCQ